MGHSTYQQALGGDMRRLEAMLARVAKSDAELLRKISCGEEVQLLDLACGACNEADTLGRFFSCGAGVGKAGI